MKYALILTFVVFFAAAGVVNAEPVDTTVPTKTDAREKLEEKAAAEEQELKSVLEDVDDDVFATLNLPEDTSKVMAAKDLRIVGNSLISTEEILASVPKVFNASGKSVRNAPSNALYDLRSVHELIENPGMSRPITARTVQGFTRAILAIYKSKGYSGIYVSVPPTGMTDGKLSGEILLIQVTEAPITSIGAKFYSADNLEMDAGFLREDYLRKWTPLTVGQVGKQKDLEDHVNLLNLNPDRYVSATVTKGDQEDTLAVNYNVYEANPWHWFLQLDNAGTKDRRYTPRIGMINTNLLGFDDMLTTYYQAPWEKGIEDEYSIYGSYDFPLWGPKLRLMLFAAYNQFDVDGGGGIDFLGHGSQYGAKLKYNLMQHDGWFVDVTGTLSRERSKVSANAATLIPTAATDSSVVMHIWGVGVDLHKRTDMTRTSISLNRFENFGGSSSRRFTAARTGAEDDFVYYTVAASHSQYLDEAKVTRLAGSVRWIAPEDRLVPAKMTTFGGMYSVRGYRESGLVADGGVIASAQFEYDLVKAGYTGSISPIDEKGKPWLRKLAPLVFFDYGRAKIKDKVAGENGVEELYSVGPGVVCELGDHFHGAVYYGFPLEATPTTDTDDGRLNLSLMLRW